MEYTKEKPSSLYNEEILKARRKKRNRRRRIFISSCIVIGLVILGIVLYSVGFFEKLLDLFGVKRDISVIPIGTDVQYSIKGNRVISAAADCIIIHDEQGVTGLSKDGKWCWNESVSVADPVFNSYNNYILLIDQGGNTLYCFGSDGLIFRYVMKSAISAAYANEALGYICVIHDDPDYLSAVTLLDISGTKMTPIEKFTVKFSTCIAVSCSISDKGDQMCVSGIYSEGSTVTGVLSFIRMSDGTVYTTKTFDNDLYIKTCYISDSVLMAANTSSLRLLYQATTASDISDKSSELWNRSNSSTILADCVDVSGKYLVAAYGRANSNEATELSTSDVVWYNSLGKECYSINIPGKVIGIISRDHTVTVLTKNVAYMYSDKAVPIATYETVADISVAEYIDDRDILLCGDSLFTSVSFKDKSN